MTKKLFASAALFALCSGLPLFACAPYFPENLSFFNDFGYSAEGVFRNELNYVFSENPDAVASWGTFPPSTLTTLMAEQLDYWNWLNRHHPNLPSEEKNRLLKQYLTAAEAVRTGKPFDLSSLKLVPDDFLLFLKGWQELESFDKLFLGLESWVKLNEQAEKYPLRCVWAAYMLGNISDVKYYERVRALASRGYSDSLGLGFASLRNQMRRTPSSAAALKLALAMYFQESRVNPSAKTETLRYLISKTSAGELLADPLIREVSLAYAMAYPNRDRTEFLEKMKNVTFKNASRIAFVAWQNGDFGAAEKYLAGQENRDVLYYWVKAQLCRVKGDYEAAADCLKKWLGFIETNRRQEKRLLYQREDINMKNDIYAKLGAVNIHKKDFLEALNCFLQARAWLDAAHVAENYIELDQLEKYVAYATTLHTPVKPRTYWMTHFGRDSISKEDSFLFLKDLLARRFVREDQPERAVPYISGRYAFILKDYLRAFRNANNKQLPDDERALAYYNLSKILWRNGMELSGTDSAPDFYFFDGNFTLEQQPQRRFQYRKKAHEFAGKALELVKDIRLKTLILFSEGYSLKRFSAEQADVLYKRLVNECRPQPLAVYCDRQRWFKECGLHPVFIEFIKSSKTLSAVSLAHELVDHALKQNAMDAEKNSAP